MSEKKDKTFDALPMMDFLTERPGRPQKSLDNLREGWENVILELAKEGAGSTEWIVALNVSNDLFYAFKDREPYFSDIIKRAEMICRSWWEYQGRELADKDFNHVLWYMNMKNRHNWADKKEIKLDASIDDKTDPEKAKRMAAQYTIEQESKSGDKDA